MISTDSLTLASANRFQGRCEYFCIKAALAYAAGATPTANELRFAKAALSGALDLRRIALSALATSNIADLTDPEGLNITDADLEISINSIAVNTGKALA